MRVMLLAAVAAATSTAIPAPVQAQTMGAALSVSSESSRHHGGDGTRFSGTGSGRLQGCDVRDGRRDGRGRRGGSGSCDISVGTWYSGGEWALYNNRSWESDSYNDWWHDRPDRAYPRWMSTNQDCQRQWWSGGGWRC